MTRQTHIIISINTNVDLSKVMIADIAMINFTIVNSKFMN